MITRLEDALNVWPSYGKKLRLLYLNRANFRKILPIKIHMNSLLSKKQVITISIKIATLIFIESREPAGS